MQNDLRLFGLDLMDLGGALRLAWFDFWRWPIFLWLQPRAVVRVVLPDGSLAATSGPDKPLKINPVAVARAKFEATQLPEDLLLRRTVLLPSLPSDEFAAALAIEAQAQSPFPLDQLIWVARAVVKAGAQTNELVLTSRALILGHLAKLKSFRAQASAQAQFPELWVTAGDGTHFVLPGFGEDRRLRSMKNGLMTNVGLLVFILVLLVALAVTPTLQLLMRKSHAEAQHRALGTQVAPVLLEREAYLKAQEQLQSITDTLGEPTSALRVLDVVTRAFPDDTSVFTLQLQRADSPGKPPRLQITGQTQNTAELMQLLGRQPGVRDVRAPTPAIKPIGATKESYSIEFGVSAPPQDLLP